MSKSYEWLLGAGPAELRDGAARDVSGVSSSIDQGIAAITPARVWFDLSDIILFLNQHLRVSGIQRVMIKLFEQFHNNMCFGRNVVFVYFDKPSNSIREIDSNRFYRLCLEIEKQSIDRYYITKELRKIQSNTIVSVLPNDVYITLGAFWSITEYYCILKYLKTIGCRIGVLIYDLIPLDDALYFDKNTSEAFRSSIVRVLYYCDFAMAISEHVAKETRRLITRNLKRNMPVYAIPLAQDAIEINRADGAAIFVAPNLRGNYVLCVGTIEVRKNHIYLFQIWKRWIEEGRRDIPQLILVGRWGWHFEQFRAALEETDYLGGKIEILSSVSDSELSFLYANSMFTAFPSFAEGWGLPIGESLVYGKPCFASKTTSMPEVGGDFVRYIDPHQVEDGYIKLTAVLDNPLELSGWGSRIKQEFVPRSWKDVAANVSAVIKEASRLPTRAQPGVIDIPAAHPIPIGEIDAQLMAKRCLRAMILPLIAEFGWHAIEPWGRWSSSKVPRLRFALEGLEKASLLRLALRLKLPKDGSSATVLALSGGLTTSFEMADGKERWYFCSAKSEPDGTVIVELVYNGDCANGKRDGGKYLGLVAIAVVEQDNVEDRLAVMENLRS